MFGALGRKEMQGGHRTYNYREASGHYESHRKPTIPLIGLGTHQGGSPQAETTYSIPGAYTLFPKPQTLNPIRDMVGAGTALLAFCNWASVANSGLTLRLLGVGREQGNCP